jgi:GH25 family lysozyme M1 (1,4-beta-N-acetylmuramidase)
MDPIAQAEWFWSNSGEVGEIEHVLDVEDTANIPPDYAERLKACLDRLETLMGGIKPMIYTRASYWKIYLADAIGWGDKYKLWVAHYKEDSGPTVSLPWSPMTWSFWQFTNVGPGAKYGAESISIDLDASNGKVDPPAVPTVEVAVPQAAPQAKVSLPAPKPTWRDYLEEYQWRSRRNDRKD